MEEEIFLSEIMLRGIFHFSSPFFFSFSLLHFPFSPLFHVVPFSSKIAAS